MAKERLMHIVKYIIRLTNIPAILTEYLLEEYPFFYIFFFFGIWKIVEIIIYIYRHLYWN